MARSSLLLCLLLAIPAPLMAQDPPETPVKEDPEPPPAEAASKTGRVTVYSKPKATILADGVDQNLVSPNTIDLPVGLHKIQVRFPDGSISAVKAIDLRPGSRIKLFFGQKPKDVAPETTSKAAAPTPKGKKKRRAPINTAPSEPIQTAVQGNLIIAGGPADPDSDWTLAMGGYIRTRFALIEDDPKLRFAGRNDGFVLSSARPNFQGRHVTGLGFRLQFELAGALGGQADAQPFQDAVVRPRDVFLYYNPFPFLNIQLGQFKPPFDLESLLPTAAIMFVNRSVGARGVRDLEGWPGVAGIALDREVGAQVSGRFHFEYDADNNPQGLGFGYSLNVTNGSPASQTYNDNDALAYHGRLTAHWGDMITVGGAAYYNEITTLLDSESAQDFINRVETGLTADLQLKVAGVTAIVNFAQRTQSLQFAQPATLTARSLQAQIGYLIPVVHIQPSYRFATYDPSAEYTATQDGPDGLDFREIDALTHHTIGLSYIAPTYPIILMLNYTIATELEGAIIDNNRLDALLQLTF